MTRPIKFRAWDIRKGVWVYFDLLKDLFIGWDTDNFKSQYFKDWGQFTGQLDSSGKGIYEGDIVLLKNKARWESDGIMDGKRLVKWEEREAKLGLSCSVEDEARQSFNWGGTKSIEIIGNIYQNPELLK